METSHLTEPDLPGLLQVRTPQGDLPLATSRQWPARRRDIFARLQALLGPLPESLPPLDSEHSATHPREGYELRAVSYRVEGEERCPAWLLVPQPLRHRQPAVVCCHGAVPQGKDEPAGVQGAPELALAVELVQRGYVCLAPDCLAAGQRVAPGQSPLDFTSYYQQHPPRSALGKMLWDHQRGLDYLCSLDEVDSDRLAACGHGLGGLKAILLGAYDHRVKMTAAAEAYVPFAADPDYKRWCTDGGPVYLPALKVLHETRQHPPLWWVEVLALLAPRAFHYSSTLGGSKTGGATGVAADMLQLGRLYDLLGSRSKFVYHESKAQKLYPPAARKGAFRLLDHTLLERG